MIDFFINLIGLFEMRLVHAAKNAIAYVYKWVVDVCSEYESMIPMSWKSKIIC